MKTTLYLIRHGATECLKRIPLERRIRLLGVRVSALIPAADQGDDPAPVQEELRFDAEPETARALSLATAA